MEAYRVRAPAWLDSDLWRSVLLLNVTQFQIDGPADGDTEECYLLLLRTDHKFAVYMNKVYRVCEVMIDDNEPYIRVWVNDPFAGFPDYEQLPNDVGTDRENRQHLPP